MSYAGSPYIMLGSPAVECFMDSCTNTGTGYLMFTDVSNIVWLKITTGAPKSGDFNGDGVVTMDEALLVARIVAGVGLTLTTEQFAAVDMDADACITMADVLLIMRKASGL